MELLLGWGLLSAQLPGYLLRRAAVELFQCPVEPPEMTEIRDAHIGITSELREILKGELREVGALLGVQKQQEELVMNE